MGQKEVRVGHWAIRCMTGGIKMKLRITGITDRVIECGGWTFDRESGAEVDEELGWGPQFGVTGSWLDGFSERGEEE